ncbi:MAG: hypothetical protein WBE50_16765, partial [Methyloceanibacter sp.]
ILSRVDGLSVHTKAALEKISRRSIAGATEAELDAIFGWTDRKMAAHYTQSANRRRLAAQAMAKLANAGGTSIPAPSHPVRAARGKSK